jgi:hypothetical protein
MGRRQGGTDGCPSPVDGTDSVRLVTASPRRFRCPVEGPRAGSWAAAGTVTTRSTTWTALRPDAAARDCSQALCRHVAEHHFGIGPRDRGVIAPWQHPHVDAAALRAIPFEPPPGFGSSGCGCRAEDRSCSCRRRRSRSRCLARYSLLPLLPMSLSVLGDVHEAGTTNSAGPGCSRCVGHDLDLLPKWH